MCVDGLEKKDFLLALFNELNEHIRATDDKSVLVGVGFLGFFGAIVTILFSKIEINYRNITSAVVQHGLPLYTILFIGVSVSVVQMLYRYWKNHYIKICRDIVSEVKIPDRMMPSWMICNTLKKWYKVSLFGIIGFIRSADYWILLITVIINVLIILLVSVQIFAFFYLFLILLLWIYAENQTSYFWEQLKSVFKN